MKLIPVGTKENGSSKVWLRCCVCGRMSMSDQTLADIHGQPFVAYYCAPCADVLKKD